VATVCRFAGVMLLVLFLFLVAAEGAGLVAGWRVDGT
jgi:hypothetical protein